MKYTVLKSKIHRITVTEAELNYEGSIEIDGILLDKAGIKEFEKVLVANFTNGKRYETYVTRGKENSGVVKVNGGGARYSCIGDILTVFSFALVSGNDVICPTIVFVDEDNHIKELK